MVNGTLLNFGKRYEDDLRVVFDQRQKLHFGLDALSNQKILKGIYGIGFENKRFPPKMKNFKCFNTYVSKYLTSMYLIEIPQCQFKNWLQEAEE